MTLTELLLKVGDDKLLMQPLDGSMTGATKKKDGTEIKFMTDQLEPGDLIRGPSAKMGLVVWLNRADVDKAMSELSAATQDPN